MTSEDLNAIAGHLLVRRVIERDDELSEAVLDIAAGDRRHWTLPDWEALLAKLAACPLKLVDWLNKDGDETA